MLKKNIGIALLITSFTTLAIAEESQKLATSKDASTKVTKAASPNVPPTAKPVANATQSKVAPVVVKKEAEPKPTVAITPPKTITPEPKPETLVDNPVVLEKVVTPVLEENGLDEVTKSSTESIRSIFSVFAEAINKSDSIKLDSVARKQLIVINSNQEFLNSKKSIEEYFPTASGKHLTRIDMSIDSGATVEMHSESLATVYGRGTETYLLGSVKHTIPMRWSAVVEKNDMKWKISSFHSGVEFADNSFVQSTTDFAWKIGAFGAAIGLLLGALIVGMLARGRK